jgi:hypothetical protein
MRWTCYGWTAATCGTGPCLSGGRDSSASCFRARREWFVPGARRKRHGPVPRDLRPGHAGIVAKQAGAGYMPGATTWVKIKNRQYSQAVGREDFFDHPKALEQFGAAEFPTSAQALRGIDSRAPSCH